MSVKTISRLLKFIIIVMGLCAFAIQGACSLIFLVSEVDEIHNMQIPWLIFIWTTAIPMIPALYYSWETAVNIGKGLAFCFDNAKNLHGIAISSLADTVIMIAGNIILLLMNMNHPSVIIFSLFIAVIGVAILIAAESLSQLIKQATALKEETDLTI